MLRRYAATNVSSSLRANRSRERAPDDRLREAIHLTAGKKEWIASSQVLLAMTMWRDRALPDRNVTTRRANHAHAQKPVQSPRKKYFAFSETQISRSVRTIPLLQRGVSRSSRTWSGLRWTLMALQDGRA
jgi:hypothetical protein